MRLSGTVDFPLYEANSSVGYIPAANQQGAFLNKNAWRFNKLHMGAQEFSPGLANDVLLVGDSLVLGGNAYLEEDRLGPRLESTLQQKAHVWPISAGRWALRNELAWLRANQAAVDQIDQFVFVVNSGDFDAASSWACELTHPLHKPRIALWYLFEKYVHAFTKCGDVPADLLVLPGNVLNELKTFLAGRATKTLFVWYPDKLQLSDPGLRKPIAEEQLAILKQAGALHIVSVSDDARWNLSLYKDGIHATAEGNKVLANIITEGLSRLPASP